MMNEILKTENQATDKALDTLIFSAAKFINQQILIGTIMVIMGLISVALVGTGGFIIGLGILNWVLSFTIDRSQYITLGPDYIALKYGMFKKVNVLFSEITSLDKTDKKITLCYRMHSEDEIMEGKLDIMLNFIPNDEKIEFIRAFSQRMPLLHDK